MLRGIIPIDYKIEGRTKSDSVGATGVIPYDTTSAVCGSYCVPGLATIDDGTTCNAVLIWLNAVAGNQMDTGLYASGSNPYDAAAGGYVAGALYEEVIAFQANNQRSAIDGTLLSDGTVTTIPTFTRLDVGAIQGGGGPTDGWLNRIWYIPDREPDTALADYTR